MPSHSPTRLLPAAHRWWSDAAARNGRLRATEQLLAALWGFARDSTPARLRQRYGDADYDWEHHVNTTSAAVGWRERLLGVFHSPYQPTEPALFHEILDTLQQQTNLNFADFTFLDLGSGKGRTLLMAADYPFRRVVGVELLPTLHQTAQENLRLYKSDAQKCFAIEAVCTGQDDLLSNELRTFVTFMRAVLRGAMTDEVFAAMQAELGARRVVELTAFCCWVMMNTRLAQGLGQPEQTAAELTAAIARLTEP